MSVGNAVLFVLLLIRGGASPNGLDIAGRTPLMMACMGNHLEVVSVLLDAEVAVDTRDWSFTSALHIAAAQQSPALVNLLMNALEASKRPRLDRLVFALGIEHVGDTVARLLVDHYGALDPMIEATEEELQAIKGIGPEVAASVRHFFSNARNRSVVEWLRPAAP